jgi:hypothetical protein
MIVNHDARICVVSVSVEGRRLVYDVKRCKEREMWTMLLLLLLLHRCGDAQVCLRRVNGLTTSQRFTAAAAPLLLRIHVYCGSTLTAPG